MTDEITPPPTDTSAAALQAGAPLCINPEPEWITKAADEYGYEWARIAWQRAAGVPGAWFDFAKADAIVERWPRWFRLTVGRFANQPFHLAFWQEVTLRLLVGWKAPVEILDPVTRKPTFVYARLFRELRLWIPRKNGKSEFLAALALLFWAIEGEARGQGYVFAAGEEQAKLAFDKMADMVSYSPVLAADVASFAKYLWIQKLRSPFRLLAGKAKGKHGKGPTVTLGDEMHEWPSLDLANTLRQGEGTSLQPIRLYASTAGLKTQRTGYALFQESAKILDGRISDPTTLVVMFAAPDDADPADEATWRGPNPSLGLSPTIAFLRSEWAKAQGNPRAEAEFRRYHLNQWVEDLVRWIPLSKWDACAPDRDAWKTREADLVGRECVGAVDVSKNFDFSAWVLRFAPLPLDSQQQEVLKRLVEAIETLAQDGMPPTPELLTARNRLVAPKLLCRFWLPSETIKRRVETEKTDFDKWRDAGALREIPGGVINQNWIIKQIEADCQAFKIQRIGFDPWNAVKLYTDLVDGGMDEELLTEMRQGAKTLGSASLEFERLIFSQMLDHGGQPVLRWMVGHCDVRFDENMNFVPAKKKSADNIDGVVAAVMAEALAMDSAPAKSFWETA